MRRHDFPPLDSPVHAENLGPEQLGSKLSEVEVALESPGHLYEVREACAAGACVSECQRFSLP